MAGFDLKRLKDEGIAHVSYLVSSGGEAAVIDPRRDCHEYVRMAEDGGLRIRHILQTHRDEDYVTGAPELASLTGAQIAHGDFEFKYGRTAGDGEAFPIGPMTLTALATPGHTPESMSYVLSGPDGPVGVFTGDALFVGEVGRTDLADPKRTKEFAGMLHDSLHGRILKLGPNVRVWPSHGAGSVCGGAISSRDESTIMEETKTNHALHLRKDDFIAMKAWEASVLEKAQYFKRMERMNRDGPPLVQGTVRPISCGEAEDMGTAMVIDVREPSEFAESHILKSVNMPMSILGGYAGWVVPDDRPLVLVGGEMDAARAAVELGRVGLDDVRGRLLFDEWSSSGGAVASRSQIKPGDLSRRMESDGTPALVDVRSAREFAEGHVPGAINVFVGQLPERMGEVPHGEVAVMCLTGKRGSLAASLLRAAGRDAVNVEGGLEAWRSAGLRTVGGPDA